jgi:hypothetical protein
VSSWAHTFTLDLSDDQICVGTDDEELASRLRFRYERWLADARPELIRFGIELLRDQTDRGTRQLPRIRHGSDVLFTTREFDRLERALDQFLGQRLPVHDRDTKVRLEMAAVAIDDRCVLVPLDTLWSTPERVLRLDGLVPIDVFEAHVDPDGATLHVSGLAAGSRLTYEVVGVWLPRWEHMVDGPLTPAIAVAELVRLTVGFDATSADRLIDGLVSLATTVPVLRQPDAPATQQCSELASMCRAVTPSH